MRNGPYELIVVPEGYPGKRYRGRYAYEHRVNWWRANGLNPDEAAPVIHHKDDTKRNNAPDNLEGMTSPEHSAHHARPITYLEHTCLHCGATFAKRKGMSPKFCSRRCIGLYGYPLAGREPKHKQHGTPNCYTAGCRCTDCRAAHAARNRDYRKRRAQRANK